MYKFDDMEVIHPIKLALTQTGKTMKGFKFLPLFKPASVILKMVQGLLTILIFGGQSLYDNCTVDFLYKISVNFKHSRKETHCTLYKKTKLSNPPDCLEQKGQVPTGRVGHTLTKLSDSSCLLIGGYATKQNCIPQNLDDQANIYMLNVEEMSWEQKPLGENSNLRGIFGHTTNCLPDGKVCVIGGAFMQGHGLRFADIGKPIILSLQSTNVIETQIHLNIQAPLPLYDHCCAIDGKNIYVFGGRNASGIKKQFVSINIESKNVDIDDSAPDDAASAGASMHLFGDRHPKSTVLVEEHLSVTIWHHLIVV